jgi:hypothetical protein
MYAAGESPMKALTSSVTAATRSPKVVLMIFRRLMFSLDALVICGRQFRVCIISPYKPLRIRCSLVSSMDRQKICQSYICAPEAIETTKSRLLSGRRFDEAFDGTVDNSRAFDSRIVALNVQPKMRTDIADSTTEACPHFDTRR